MDPEQLIDLTPLRPRRPPSEENVAAASRPPPVSLRPPPPLLAEQEQEPAPPPRREDLSYIWGTDIAVETFRAEFLEYLETFEAPQHGMPAGGGSLGGGPSSSGGHILAGSSTALLHDLSSSHRLGGGGGGGGGGEKYYIREMKRMHLKSYGTLAVDLTWLRATAPRLYSQIIHHPTECLQMMSAVAEELYRDVLQHRYGLHVPDDVIIVAAPMRLPSTIPLKELSPQNVEQLISIKGMVIRVSKVIPEIRVACFQCWNCQYIERSVSGDRGRIFEPTRCQHCGRSFSFRLQHNLSLYEDKQLVKVQESPEHVSDGETPISISVVVYGGMVDLVVPGDRVVVTGIYRTVPIRLNTNTRIIKSIFSTHLDAVHVERVRATRQQHQKLRTSVATTTTATVGGGGAGTASATGTAASHPPATTDAAAAPEGSRTLLEDMSSERLDTFHRIAHRSDIYDILLNSFARTIWGHEDVKRGILAQLFGGTPKKFTFSTTAPPTDGTANTTETNTSASAAVSSRNSATFRAELNVILCGDPGVAKSQLLTQVHEIAPRGVYTSGKGSSSVGLTAFVVQDSDTGELVLEPGALVLSDQGLCCIDEFDKMNEATRSVLHEVMEQQTLSVAKAGIIAQLNARTSILAAANPKESQWNAHLNVVENLQIEPTLLSRFDLIFLLLDCHDPAEDRRLASHVLSLYMDSRAGGTDATTTGDDDDDARTDRTTVGSAGSPTGTESARPLPQTTDPTTGLPVDVHLQLDGEVFLLGPRAAPYMPTAILSEYIAIARDTVFPQLTEPAHRQLAASYVELRQARGGSRTVSATLRQLESMIRLAEAHAKMRYDTTVAVEDVQEAKRLISAALKEAATDPRTGLVSLGMFHAPDPTRNTTEGNMKRLEEVMERRYVSQGRATATVAELRQALNEQLTGGLRPIAPAQLLELLALLSGGDLVKSFTPTTVTFTQRTGGGSF